MRGVVNLATALLAAFVLAGCNSTGSGGTVSEAELIGRWILTKSHTKGAMSMTVAGQTNTTNIDTTTVFTGTANYVDFKADHTYEANNPSLGLHKSAVPAAPETGTWSVSGDVVTTITTDKKDTLAMTADIEGATGTFSITVDESVEDGAYKMVTHYDITMTAAKQP